MAQRAMERYRGKTYGVKIKRDLMIDDNRDMPRATMFVIPIDGGVNRRHFL